MLAGRQNGLTNGLIIEWICDTQGTSPFYYETISNKYSKSDLPRCEGAHRQPKRRKLALGCIRIVGASFAIAPEA